MMTKNSGKILNHYFQISRISHKRTLLSLKRTQDRNRTFIFIKAVENLEIQLFIPNIENNTETKGIDEIIKIYKKHPSILKIKEI